MTAPDLEAISAEFLTQCAPCDFAMRGACNCPKRDYRGTMLDLVREVERYREALTSLAGDCESFPADHPWAAALTSTAHRVRLILAGERP